MRDYYNTNKEVGQELINSIKTAGTQQDLTFVLFQLYPYQSFTPPEIKDLFEYTYKRRIILTTMRRVLSNLTKVGLITKNDNDMKAGIYGKANHTWVYIPEKRIA